MRDHRPFRTSNRHDVDSDSGDEFTSFKIRGNSISQKGRKKPEHKCLQNNLLYATNLPLWFEDDKYGTIQGIMSSTKSSMANSDEALKYVQSYITYKDERDVALVIAVIQILTQAINEMMCFSLSLKTTYGTSRLCNNYINGKRCTVKGCFWLHDEKNVIKFQGPFKADFQKQRQIAYEIVKKNLPYYIEKIELRKNDSAKAKDEALVRFPSIKETIQKLIDKKILSRFNYQKAYEQYLSTKKKMSETVKKIVYVRKRTSSNTESDLENDKQTRTKSVKEPVKDESPKIQKQANIISTYFQAKKKEKSQFLMSRIMESLQENEDSTTKTTKAPEARPKIEWQPLPQFTDYFTQKLFQEQELMETQESQSGEKSSGRSVQQTTICGSQIQLPYTYEHPSVQTEGEEQTMLLDRVKNQIFKSRLVKISMLQFTESVPFRQHEAEFQKVTNILKNRLIAER